MIASLLLLLQPATVQPPQRTVADPGVFAVGQRVTPAGVQSVFNGRVASVRFGSEPGEVWAVVPGTAWRLAWQDNRVLTQIAFNGRPGVHGMAIDPVTKQLLLSSVGRLPADVAASRIPGGPPLARAKAVAQLVSYRLPSTNRAIDRASDRVADSARIATESGALGDFLAGGPSVAAQAGPDGRRVALLPLPADDKLVIIDVDDGRRLRTVPLGVLPVASVVSRDGRSAWVTVFGGPRPQPGQRSATQCCDPAAEPVRVNRRGIALPGTVERIDVLTGTVTHRLTVGAHPTGLVWDEARQRLYVANGNSDTVSVIDTRANIIAGVIAVTPFRERRIGLTPTALALAPDGQTLFVTLGGVNAVALYDVRAPAVSGAVLRGLIPTGWYPSSIDVSADGRTIAVGTLFGVGAGTGRTAGQTGRYVFAERGSLHVIPVPTDAELAAYTTSVAENNRLHLTSGPAGPSLAPRAGVAARAVPERPGEPSPIQHVVYIIRENRTFDQVFGDFGKGARDSSLTMFGRAVTPNAHALSEQFVLLDHFFASGGNSADGHNWLTQANETAYPMWPLYTGRSYPSEGNDPLTYSAGGFLWENVAAKGLTARSFGEYAPAPTKERGAAFRRSLLTQMQDSLKLGSAWSRRTLTKFYNTRSEIPSLDRILVREYPGWTQDIPDVMKADVVLDHLKEWEAAKRMPNLTLIVLPNDHTEGTSAGWCTPAACVADNDLALGRLVEGLSHSSFWKSMAILVVEDDAQNGVDHIDGHRTVALVASPYAKRGVIDSTFYSQPSMVKTIELMLGLPAMSLFDLVATDMRASFIGPNERPDFTPFTALVPQQSLLDVNVRTSEMRGPDAALERAAALASARMNFREPDAAPTERLNRILWGAVKGWRTPYPEVKQSLFFPLAVDIDDDDREEREEREPPTPVRRAQKPPACVPSPAAGVACRTVPSRNR